MKLFHFEYTVVDRNGEKISKVNEEITSTMEEALNKTLEKIDRSGWESPRFTKIYDSICPF